MILIKTIVFSQLGKLFNEIYSLEVGSILAVVWFFNEKFGNLWKHNSFDWKSMAKVWKAVKTQYFGQINSVES